MLLVVACSWTAADPEVAAEPPLPLVGDALQAERDALHEAELSLLTRRVDAKLSASELGPALTPLLAAERLGGLPDRVDRALAMAEADDPGLAAQLHAALAEAIRSDRERAARHAAQATRLEAVAEIHGRYGGDATQSGVARTRGVTLPMLGAALTRAVEGHVAAPEPSVLAHAGARRLEALATSPGAQEAFPGVQALAGPARQAQAAPASELSDAVASGEALVAVAVEAGVPESVAIAEWVEGALSAFDPWTSVAWPAELGAWEAHHSGVVVGVGVELEAVGDAVVVALPTPDGPAWRAGVHRGDQVLAVRGAGIDGRLTAEAGVEALAGALRGEPGTDVTLELARAGERLERVIARAPVRRQTVHGWTRSADNAEVLAIAEHPELAYVRIEAFRDYTDEELRGWVEAQPAVPAGVVLDLRGNPGGDVQAAANVADLFVGEGIVATLEGPAAPPPPAEGELGWNALVPGDPWEAVPVVVLVDRETASAGEILAGALAARDGVTLVGERSFGKGYSQGLQLVEEHGFALQLTNAAWHLPDGTGIQRIPGETPGGVAPDRELVASAAESWQNQARRRALEFPRSHADGSPMLPPDHGSAAELPTLSADPAIEAALRLLGQEQADGGVR